MGAEGIMQFHRVEIESDDVRRRRRLAIRKVWPAFTSERLVRLFEAIILIAATRPDRLKTIEIDVAAAMRPQQARATLGESPTRSGDVAGGRAG